MKLKSYFSKITYIIKEEGINVFLKRSLRYVVYILNRKLRDFSEDIDKWNAIKGRFPGKRAFIIGNGPSLNKLPLHLLANEHVICFNRFDLMLERLGWKPFAYAAIDDLVLSDVPEVANYMATQAEYAFFPDLHPSAKIGKNFKKAIPPRDNIYWLHLGDIGFNDNLPNCGINKTVANVAVQILVFMGFSEIYFIGVDLDYQVTSSMIKENERDLKSEEDDDPNHFDPRYFGKGRKFHHPRMKETFEKFDEAAVFLKAKNVKGFNAGIGGKLESFERVEFNSLFNYSNKEILQFMVGHLIDEIVSEDLIECFPKAVKISSFDDWDDDNDEIICTDEMGPSIIPKKVIDYFPLGPYKGEYLFLSKKKYSK